MPYYGKPENQKNQKALRLDPPTKATPTLTTEAPKPTTTQKPSKTAHPPQPLAKPTNLQSKPFRGHLTETAPNQDAIFAKDTNLYEVAPKADFTPTYTAFNSVVSTMYQAYTAKNVLTAKTLSHGMLNYYCATMTWFRNIDIKRQNGQTLTETEKTIFETIKFSIFSLPKPFAIYLKSVGNITSATEQTLIPQLPAYPITNGHSHHGAITVANHNDYELYPSVGVAAEVLQQELNATQANWQPSVVPNNTSPTSNLQGFIHPVEQKSEIKSILIGAGVTVNEIGETIEATDINLPLLQAISSALERLEVFALEATSFQKMEPHGSAAQLVQIRKARANATTPIANGEVSIYDYTRDSAGTVGLAITYQYNVHRDGPIANQGYLSWCCLRNAANHNTVDQAWVDNRNDLRVYPPQYLVRVFTTGSRNATVFRTDVFEELAK